MYKRFTHFFSSFVFKWHVAAFVWVRVRVCVHVWDSHLSIYQTIGLCGLFTVTLTIITFNIQIMVLWLPGPSSRHGLVLLGVATARHIEKNMWPDRSMLVFYCQQHMYMPEDTLTHTRIRVSPLIYLLIHAFNCEERYPYPHPQHHHQHQQWQRQQHGQRHSHSGIRQIHKLMMIRTAFSSRSPEKNTTTTTQKTTNENSKHQQHGRNHARGISNNSGSSKISRQFIFGLACKKQKKNQLCQISDMDSGIKDSYARTNLCH